MLLCVPLWNTLGSMPPSCSLAAPENIFPHLHFCLQLSSPCDWSGDGHHLSSFTLPSVPVHPWRCSSAACLQVPPVCLLVPDSRRKLSLHAAESSDLQVWGKDSTEKLTGRICGDCECLTVRLEEGEGQS